MRVLAIGNSFSQDATRYLHGIARSEGVDIDVSNLYIGGCTLAQHYNNMLGDLKAYDFFFNGNDTKLKVSIKDMLLTQGVYEGNWDYITIQQGSRYSFDYSSYQPYITEIIKFVKKYAPKAKILIHQTWAYEQGSELLKNVGYEDYVDMYHDIVDAYAKAADDINADGIIESGRLMKKMLANGMPKVHRDTFHADLGFGRYALALLWYKVLTGNDVKENKFKDFDVPVSKEEIEIVKECVSKI